MTITFEAASRLSDQILELYGYTAKEAETITCSLLWSQKRNNFSQGLSKLFGWHIKKRKDAAPPTVEIQSATTLLVNANMTSHIVALDFALRKWTEQTDKAAIFTIGVKNTDNSAGALGFFTEQIAQQGNIAIMVSAADPGVTPYGGSTAIFGTNPISIAVPTSHNPILLDMSIASLTWGDLVKTDIEGKKLPEGFAFDADGNPTIDPKAAMEGSVTSFDQSYKGSGLALMVQILAGPLVGSIYSTSNEVCQYGSLVIVIKTDAFGNKAVLEQIDQLISEVKSVKTTSGFDEIILPGELGYRNSNTASKSGSIEILDELYNQINEHIEKNK